MNMPTDLLDTVEPISSDHLDIAIFGQTTDPDYQGGHLDTEQVEGILGWTPPDIEQADWAGRKWVAANAEIAEVNRVANEQIERIKAWQNGQTARLTRTAGFFEGVLSRYAIGRRIATKAATTKLPSVTISTRKVKEGVDVVDEAAAIAWAEERGIDETVVKTTKKFLKSVVPDEMLSTVAPFIDPEHPDEPVARYVDPTSGEFIPGLQYRPAGTGVTVKANTL